MTAKLIDGTAIAAKVRAQVAADAEALFAINYMPSATRSGHKLSAISRLP